MRSHLRSALRVAERLASKLDPLPDYPAILTAPPSADIPLDAMPEYFGVAQPAAPRTHLARTVRAPNRLPRPVFSATPFPLSRAL